MVLEQTLHRHRAHTLATASLDLAQVTVGGVINANQLRALASGFTSPVLWISPLRLDPLPEIRGMSESEMKALSNSLHDECSAMAKELR